MSFTPYGVVWVYQSGAGRSTRVAQIFTIRRRIPLRKVADAAGGDQDFAVRSGPCFGAPMGPSGTAEGFCLWQQGRECAVMALSPQQRFAANLRRVRNKAGVSQEELAQRCGLHRTEVSLLERAGREPRLGTIVKLAGALGTTPAVLCEGITWSVERSQYAVKPPPGDGAISVPKTEKAPFRRLGS